MAKDASKQKSKPSEAKSATPPGVVITPGPPATPPPADEPVVTPPEDEQAEPEVQPNDGEEQAQPDDLQAQLAAMTAARDSLAAKVKELEASAPAPSKPDGIPDMVKGIAWMAFFQGKNLSKAKGGKIIRAVIERGVVRVTITHSVLQVGVKRQQVETLRSERGKTKNLLAGLERSGGEGAEELRAVIRKADKRLEAMEKEFEEFQNYCEKFEFAEPPEFA